MRRAAGIDVQKRGFVFGFQTNLQRPERPLRAFFEEFQGTRVGEAKKPRHGPLNASVALCIDMAMKKSILLV